MSLQVIIVEDERVAANNLQCMLLDLDAEIQVRAILSGIEEAVEWLAINEAPQLAFFDIQLEDGLSFDIFKRIEISFPVIFTTAFDEYAIQAFKVNSVDYLLKPIKERELAASLQKYKTLTAGLNRQVIDKILNTVHKAPKATTFLVHYKNRLIPVSASDLAFFYIEEGLVRGVTFDNKPYPIENTLEELEEMLDANQFFRANRQYIVQRKAIQEIEFYFNGRLSLKLLPSAPELVLVSKARVPVLKNWVKGW